MMLRVALFEAAAILSAGVAVVPVAVSAAKSWIAAKRKRARKITVTLSDGEELKITTNSALDTDKIIQFLTKVKSDELEAQGGSPPGEVNR
jgi:hypothetical protein